MQDSSNNDDDNNTVVTPFEWITDCSSVLPLVESALSTLSSDQTSSSAPRVLHVGSGSSVLGETILETFGATRIQEVVNCDVDGETLQKMKRQWQAKQHPDKVDKVKFMETDFSTMDKALPYPAGYFHLVVDKGTLDCTLCSDCTTAGMLSEIYRLLDPHGGIYILVSFHHVELLRPLLEDMPGVDWQVTHQVLQRQVEDLIGNNNNNNNNKNHGKTTTTTTTTTNTAKYDDDDQLAELLKTHGTGPWANGSFEPDEYYRRFANVFICRRQGNQQQQLEEESSTTTNQNHQYGSLDRNIIAEHVQHVNDDWFQRHNPMLTDGRKQEIQQLFHDHNNNGDDESSDKAALYDLELAYKIIFTDEEREHFTYDLFLEDWNEFVSNQNDPLFPKNQMTVPTALDFLKAMQ